MQYSKRFEAIFPWLLEWEGGYDNDPDDPGGETNYGIDKRSHPNVDIKHLTKDGAKAIYWKSYWQAYKCEDYPYPLGEVVFNCCVNAGYGRAKQFLTAGVNANIFLNEQEAFYHRLVEAIPKSQKYLRGWLNRTNALRKWVKLDTTYVAN